METEDLLETIAANGPLESTDDARRALEATLETLGERITDGQATDLAEGLPDSAAGALTGATPGEAEAFSAAAFLDRVADRTETDADPVAVARSVVAAVHEAGEEDELERTREQLPDEFDLIFDPGERTTDEEFYETVAAELPDGADVDPREATESTLETLGERITGGQAGDLATYLPRGVREPLTPTDEGAEQLDRDRFLDRVADRSGAAEDEARDVTRAVAIAVSETAAAGELEDVRSQLPGEYDRLFE